MVTANSQRRFRTVAMAAAMLGLVGPALSAQQLRLDQGGRKRRRPRSRLPTDGHCQLSMDQAVAMGLETNLGLKAQRLDVDIAAEAISGARAAFKPLLSSSFGRTSSVSVPSSFTEGSTDITNQRMNVSTQIAQNMPWFGGNYFAQWSNNRNTQVGGTPTFSPNLGSTLTLSFTQPILRDFRIDPNRAALQTTERQRAISDICSSSASSRPKLTSASRTST